MRANVNDMASKYGTTALMVALLLYALVGCGRSDLPDLAPVRGVVTMDGQPLANTEVVFAPENGRPSIGVTDENGEYEMQYTVDIKGAIVGHHTVTVSSRPPAGGEEGFVETIPLKYNGESVLTADVESGRNSIDFELESN